MEERLLDLSLRNRLINYADRSAVALTVPEGQLAAIENFVHDGTPITLLPGDQLPASRGTRRPAAGSCPRSSWPSCSAPRGVHRRHHRRLRARLRNLAYKAKTVIEETGANNLYLALGSLVLGARRPAAALAAGADARSG